MRSLHSADSPGPSFMHVSHPLIIMQFCDDANTSALDTHVLVPLYAVDGVVHIVHSVVRSATAQT